MLYIHSYNPMKEISVTIDDVEEWKNKIVSQLYNNQYIHLGERFNELRNYPLNHRREDAARVFHEFSNKVLSFMAFQEALFQLVNEGEIMPVTIPNTYSFGSYDLRISYAEISGGCTHSGQRTLSIPIYVHEHFIRYPSKHK